MKILNLSLNQKNDVINFNKTIYPERKNIEDRFQHQVINNPLLKDKDHLYGFLSYNEHNEITGQFLLNPFEFYFSGRDYRGFLAFDYYVLENYRGECGAFLALKAIRFCTPYFAIGVTDIAKKIHLFLGIKVIGSLEKFIWFRSIFSPLLIANYFISKNHSLSKQENHSQFPDSFSVAGIEFKLIKHLDEWNDYHWENTLEFSRGLEFLKWRFFGNLKDYYFYLAQDAKIPYYFVVRKSFWKGLMLIIIVDYKIPYQDKTAWNTVLNSSKLLAKMNNCNGVLTFSSHKFFDAGLQKNLFIKIGNPNLILTNAKISSPREDIQKRNLVYATMADSDTDYNFDNI